MKIRKYDTLIFGNVNPLPIVMNRTIVFFVLVADRGMSSYLHLEYLFSPATLCVGMLVWLLPNKLYSIIALPRSQRNKKVYSHSSFL